MKKAILVMAYGGPDSLADVEPYLLDIRGGRPTSPELIAEVRERYARIGGRSPLLEITRAQASTLEQCLNQLAAAQGSGGDAYRVYVGMRHWNPYIQDAVAQIVADGYTQVTAFCMAPHASKMSTGAYLQKVHAAREALAAPLEVNFIESWYDQAFLIQALARKVRAAAGQFPPEARGQIHHLFTAHSLPAVLKDQGDPYATQLERTTQLLAQELGLASAQWRFCYQSAAAGAVQWLGPAIEETLPECAKAGIHHVLVTPVGFMADHVEILYDLDIQAQEIAQKLGIRLVRSESLNTAPDFIEGLAHYLFERTAI